MTNAKTSESQARTAWWHGLVAGAWHGAVMVLAFAPFGLSALMLLAPLGVAWICRAPARRPWLVAVGAMLGILPAWLFIQQWVIPVSVAGYVPMCLYLSAFEGLVVWLVLSWRAWSSRAPMSLVVPVVWIGAEYLRSEVAFTGYAMITTAQPLIDAGPLGWSTRLAWLLGTYGVGLVALLPATGLVDLLSGRRWWSGGAVGVFVIVSIVGAVWPDAPMSERTVRVGIVQTNIEQSNKAFPSPDQQLANWREMRGLILEAAAGEPDVIVLPETMFPGLTMEPASVEVERREELSWALSTGERLATVAYFDDMMSLSEELGIPLLVGAVAAEDLWFERLDDGRIVPRMTGQYNSVYVVLDGEVGPTRYDKMRLTPFGEVMPYISSWPWLERQLMAIGASGMSFDLDAGGSVDVFEVGDGVVVATPICFEATMGDHCRRLVLGGGRRAGLLINVTNDGWFGGFDAGRRHHLLAARWRCLELRTPMVRAANTGISVAIDAQGRVMREAGERLIVPPRTQGVLLADVALAHGPVPSGWVGGLIGRGCLVAVLVIVPLHVVRSRTRARRASKEPGEVTGDDG